MEKQNVHIGCSSYYNSQWQGIFYPSDLPRAKWFDYYCEHFQTFEINATFYKFPTVRTLTTWYKKAPEIFTFSVKAPKAVTHLKKFVDCETEMAEFYTVCKAGLQEKLGPILFQLPPSFSFTPERLQLICQAINPEYNNVIEFRNSSWWIPEVYAEFKKSGISFCNVSYSGLPENLIQTSEMLYFRFHGKEQLFYSGYDAEFLQRTIDEILMQTDSAKAFVYFNNTASTEGIMNALTIQKLLDDK